ncbi:unnamed protein product (macronuclear) [Paramecium tetraurelia]|uniref:NR LBD domain-containing protein n=1 Tax=Paramecium tetraurelia TaxID=5888 RepID=A0DG66_PARTE|nr:uncharacterized protein GSPATT00002161001 [Paramecium tetraurelia]CAK82033.1 unnamed protein product [Paramecium tetraurelia]|eukprot:XP_001449430.1 hypothetical protein (macronuclear) [Paramecium tetraurelia strain d4-2]
MSQQDERSEEIEDFKKPSQFQSEEQRNLQEITEQFNHVNIQSAPSGVQSPQLASELHSHRQDQSNNSPQSNFIKIDKRFLLPEQANYITYLSDNTKMLKEKYVEHCMDSLQSIQDFVLSQGLSRKKQQSYCQKNDQSSQLNNQPPHIMDLSLQNSGQFQKINLGETSQKKQSTNSKSNIKKLKEDPQFQEKLFFVFQILDHLKKFEIQSSSKKISILEDSLIVCFVFLQLSNESKSLQEQYDYIQKHYNYQRSFQAFSTRIKVQRNLYQQWTLEKLEQLLKVLQRYPKKDLEDLTLIYHHNIKIPTTH